MWFKHLLRPVFDSNEIQESNIFDYSCSSKIISMSECKIRQADVICGLSVQSSHAGNWMWNHLVSLGYRSTTRTKGQHHSAGFWLAVKKWNWFVRGFLTNLPEICGDQRNVQNKECDSVWQHQKRKSHIHIYNTWTGSVSQSEGISRWTYKSFLDKIWR